MEIVSTFIAKLNYKAFAFTITSEMFLIKGCKVVEQPSVDQCVKASSILFYYFIPNHALCVTETGYLADKVGS